MTKVVAVLGDPDVEEEGLALDQDWVCIWPLLLGIRLSTGVKAWRDTILEGVLEYDSVQ